MRSVLHNIVIELQPLAIWRVRQLRLYPLHRRHITQANQFLDVIIAQNSILEIGDAALWRLGSGRNGIVIAGISRQVLWIARATFNSREEEPAKLATLHKLRAIRLKNREVPVSL